MKSTATIKLAITDLDRLGIEVARSKSFSIKRAVAEVLDRLIAIKRGENRIEHEFAIEVNLSALLWHYIITRGQIIWGDEDE